VSARERLDAELERHRQLFRDGPVGAWVAVHDGALGIGFDGTGLFGARIEFRLDGSGALHSWGFRGEERDTFRWRPVGPFEIEVRLVDGEPQRDGDRDDGGDPERLRYEFAADPGSGSVIMREPSCSAGPDRFWSIPGPVRLASSDT
jgi:hypothetical protein